MCSGEGYTLPRLRTNPDIVDPDALHCKVRPFSEWKRVENTYDPFPVQRVLSAHTEYMHLRIFRH